MDYETAWRWQKDAATVVKSGGSEALALLQHSPVYTFGRRVQPQHLLASRAAIEAKGAGVIESDRGGDVTFHGPGQLVGYAILDLRRRGLGPTEYVRKLEEVLLRTLDRYGVEALRRPSLPGAWTSEGKVAAIGVRIEQGVSLHGFALNVDVDLDWFASIVPCGLTDSTVTSMSRLLGESPRIEAVGDEVAARFAEVFNSDLVPVDTGEGLESAGPVSLLPMLRDSTRSTPPPVPIAHSRQPAHAR